MACSKKGCKGCYKCGGHIPKYPDGGNIKDSIYTKYPAMAAYETQGLSIVPDTNFTREATGIGDIEYLSPAQDTVRYGSGYKLPHPSPGSHAIYYNPKTNNQQSIELDLLHGMPVVDPKYKKKLSIFEESFRKVNQEEMDHWYKQAVKEGRALDGKEQWEKNYIDGILRNLLFEGTSEDFRKSRYWEGARGHYLKGDVDKSFKGIQEHLKTPVKKNGGWLDELKSAASEYAEDYRNFNLEKEIDNYLNNPQIKARKIATSENEREDSVDNIRHAQAGRLTGKAIEDKTGNIPYLSKAAGFLGATAAGIGHEVMAPNTDISWYNTIIEGAEDIYNNTYGAYQNLLDISDEERSNKIFKASYNNQLPDGNQYGEGNMYFGPQGSDKKAYGKKAKGGWLDSFEDGGEVKSIEERVLANELIKTDNYKEYLEALEIYNHALGLDADGVPNVDGPVQEPKYTGEGKPYVAKDKADFDYRQQMYQDSLALSNYSDLQKNLEKSFWKTTDEDEFTLEKASLDAVKGSPNISFKGGYQGPDFAYRNEKGELIRVSDLPIEKSKELIDYKKRTGEDKYPLEPILRGGQSPDLMHPGIAPIDSWYGEGKNYTYVPPTQKVYPPSESFPNTTSGEFDREITRMPKPTPRPAIPEKMESQEARVKMLDNLSTMPTRNFAQEKITKVMDGKMMDKYVRPNVSNVRSNRDYASANLPGKKPRGMSREEYTQYFLEKKKGGWIDSYEDGGKIEGDDKKPSWLVDLDTSTQSLGSEDRKYINTPTEKPRFETEEEEFVRKNKELMKANTPAAGTATPMVGIDDPIFNAMLLGAPSMGGKLGSSLLSEATMGATDVGKLTYQVGKAGYKGAKKAVDSGSQVYKDYLAKPLRKELEPQLKQRAVKETKKDEILRSFTGKDRPVEIIDNSKLLPEAVNKYSDWQAINETANMLRQKGTGVDSWDVADAITGSVNEIPIPEKIYRGVKIPMTDDGIKALNNPRIMDYRYTKPENLMTDNEGMMLMQQYATDPDVLRMQGIANNTLGNSNYLHKGLWSSSKKGAKPYSKPGMSLKNNSSTGKLEKTKEVTDNTNPVGMLQEFDVPNAKDLLTVNLNGMTQAKIEKLMSKTLGKPLDKITLKEAENLLRKWKIDGTTAPGFAGTPEFHLLPGKMTPGKSTFQYKQGGWLDSY